MGRETIFNIPGNRETLNRLTEEKKRLVPFIGAGFSSKACPTWADFLERFFQSIKKEFLQPEDENRYLDFKNNGTENPFEKMADLLVNKSGRRKFEEEIRDCFDKPLLPEMKKKFHLLHQAFPGLKITTNFDSLIECSAPSHVKVCYGDQPGELQRLLTLIDSNSLLKIHGGLRDIHSIVLSSAQYEKIYGHPIAFDPAVPLPAFLTRLFTNNSVLFLGCSLVRDRIIRIMESLPDMHPHFAVMRKPGNREKIVEMNRRLSVSGIYPIWIDGFEQIGELLEHLAGPLLIQPVPLHLEHGVPFVGRDKELRQLRENIETSGDTGSVQMITGRLFTIEGAGGVGKTTLAIEAAGQFSSLFKDGVLPPIRVDEHTPMSFAVYLAEQFRLTVKEPADDVTARGLVSAILKERHALLILDNAVDWKSLTYMLPVETRSVILVTTRSREMYDRLRLQFSRLNICEIPLEKFTGEEALALFKRILGDSYCEAENDIYLEIARNLGFLPIALRQAISLMLFGPKYTGARLLDKLVNEDRLALLRKGRAVEGSDSGTIESVFDLSSPLLSQRLIEALEYLAICSPGPVPLEFLQQLAKDTEIEERLEQLNDFSWCECRQIDGRKSYELHQLVRELVQARFGSRFKEDFIRSVNDIYLDEQVHFSIKERFIYQLEEAFSLAKEGKDKRLIDWLYGLFYFCTYCGYGDFYIRLTEGVEGLFPEDKWAMRTVYGHRALILNAWGKLEEAMSLHKKEEEICKELGDRAGLAISCWNQGLIYKKKGDNKKHIQLWQKSIQINKQIGIPTAKYEKALKKLLRE